MIVLLNLLNLQQPSFPDSQRWMSIYGGQLRQDNKKRQCRCGYAILIVVAMVVMYIGWFSFLDSCFLDREDCGIEPMSCAPCPPKEETAAPLQDVVKPTFPFRLRIVVFTYNRIIGLRRILASLVSADYPPEAKAAGAISLHIFMDYPKKSLVAKAGGGPLSSVLDGTRDFLDDFEWPHGPMKIHRREVNMGLKRSIMEGWYPTKASLGDTPEFCAFFEDDIEVSRHWFTWTDAALRKYAGVGGGTPGGSNKKVGGNGTYSTNRDSKLLGLSLFRPVQDELSGNMSIVDNGDNPFILQQPCSWGAVYFPWLWREFRQWFADLPPNYDPALTDSSDPGVRPSSNSWPTVSSWKKYLIQRMHTRGWFMVYPNLPDTMVLSTNHLLQGEHPLPPRRYFELPLYDGQSDANAALTNLPPLKDMQAFDVMFRSRGKGPSNLPNYLLRA